jgi:hypothetical protein
MLTPIAWIRQQRLERALIGYPVYDPPHKVEERLLPKEQAQENFDYFMQVRTERCAHFQDWLKRKFGVEIRADLEGVSALNDWFVRYGGLLVPTREIGNSYFSYDPPWTGAGLRCNVLFDVGIAMGEFLIANCPNLHWEMGPTAPFTEKRLRLLRDDFGSGYQRPEITGFRFKRWVEEPLHNVEGYAAHYRRLVNVEDRWKRLSTGITPNQRFMRYLTASFTDALDLYLTGSPQYKYQGEDFPLGDEDD